MEPRTLARGVVLTMLALHTAAPRLRAQAAARARLVTAATTDVHGRLRGWDYYENRRDPSRSLAAAATIVDSIRAANPDQVLLVDAGDLLQGNPLTTVAARRPATEPHPVIAAMNAMRYDAAAIGNHEFNYGLTVMRGALAQARFPFLSANTVRANGSRAFTPFTMVTRQGLRVAIIGATTPGVAVWDRDHVKGRLAFRDIVTSLQRAVVEARRQGAQVVVGVIHAGLDGPASYDTVSTRLPGENVVARVAREVPGIDLLVFGHSHRELADSVINGVRVLQPRFHAQSVGVATLELERTTRGTWRVASSSGRTIPVTGHDEAPAVLTAVAAAHERAMAFVAESLAVTPVAWRADSARATDVALSDLVGEVMRRAARTDLAASPAFDLGVRLAPGRITTAQIARLYPFENTLRGVRITGAQLRAFLEHSARYWRTWTPGQAGSLVDPSVPGYNFDMVVGADYALDLSKPVGQRVQGLRVRGRDVADTDRFTIALSNYRQTGGGGFAMLRDAPVVFDSQVDIRDLIIQQVRAAGTLRPDAWASRNWRIVPAAAEAAALASVLRDAPRPRPASGTRVRVIGLNDFHGAFEARADARGTKLGGAGALVGAIRAAERECQPPACVSVIVDGGDMFQGTPASNLAYGRPVVSLYDSIGVVAAALGNHEFDWGQDTLRARMRQASYAILSANVRDSVGGIPSWVRQDTLVERGGVRIGIIGVSTVETPNTTRAMNVANLRFIDPAPVVSARAAALRARGAHVVLVAAHAGGFCRDDRCDGEIMAFVNRLTQPIDAVVSGHTHSLVRTQVRGVPIVQARSRGQALAVIDLAVGDTTGRASGDLPTARAVEVSVRDVRTDDITADAQAERIAARAVADVAPIVSRPVGRVLAPIRREGNAEHALGNLIADAMREATRADIAVMNNGGIRADLPAGDATYGTLYEIQPFANVLYTLTVRGDALRRYLGRLVSGTSLRGQVSGVELLYDPTQPPDNRLVDARVGGRPIESTRRYTITMNDFMVTGGDGLGLAGAAEETVPNNIVDLDALIAYFRARPGGVAAPAIGRVRTTRTNEE